MPSSHSTSTITTTVPREMGSIDRPLARSLGPHTLDWSSETWSKASERATVGLDQIRTRFFYRLRLVYIRSSLMRKPPHGFAIQLRGELKGSKGGCLNQSEKKAADKDRLIDMMRQPRL